MNLVGAGGKGESVWLAWFLVDVLERMAELSAGYTRRRAGLIERTETAAWDGEWYLRAFFDDVTPLGSATNAEAQIDSLPQSWARLCGAGNEDRTQKALDSAWRRLVH